MNLTERLRFAHLLAREGGELALRMRGAANGVPVTEKGPQDFVTAADLAVEDLIRSRLSNAFPDEAILGEEGGRDGATGGPVWIIDPIDGTTNFMRGSPDWAISIGWSRGLEPTLGVIFAPDHDLLAEGHLGADPFAQLNGRPLRVRGNTNLASSLVSLGWSNRSPLDRHTALIAELIERGSEYRRPGSATIGLIGVAAGWVDAYAEERLNLWDAAAGMAIIRAAGGNITAPAFTAELSEPAPFLALARPDHELAPILQRFLRLRPVDHKLPTRFQ